VCYDFKGAKVRERAERRKGGKAEGAKGSRQLAVSSYQWEIGDKLLAISSPLGVGGRRGNRQYGKDKSN